MGNHRWPGIAELQGGGTPIHGRRTLAAQENVSVELVAVFAYPGGLSLRLMVTATGAVAAAARHETRPLTDPADTSARWSYLLVRVRVDDQDAVADPFHPLTRALGTGPEALYRSEPRYWIPLFPASRAIAVTTGWPEIGLDPTTTLVEVGQCPFTEAG
ncbi:hypothetical protein [Rhodococcus sp. NPDC057529]|uniref:hypothetical protein n=1 Tax=Rhodococcus sp. NPDC057529 TaxID=3346158 RepID=UPI00366C8003